MAGAQRDFFSAGPKDAVAGDHRVHLFLIVLGVVVFEPLGARCEFELIDRKPATPSWSVNARKVPFRAST